MREDERAAGVRGVGDRADDGHRHDGRRRMRDHRGRHELDRIRAAVEAPPSPPRGRPRAWRAAGAGRGCRHGLPSFGDVHAARGHDLRPGDLTLALDAPPQGAPVSGDVRPGVEDVREPPAGEHLARAVLERGRVRVRGVSPARLRVKWTWRAFQNAARRSGAVAQSTTPAPGGIATAAREPTATMRAPSMSTTPSSTGDASGAAMTRAPTYRAHRRQGAPARGGWRVRRGRASGEEQERERAGEKGHVDVSRGMSSSVRRSCSGTSARALR